MLHGGFPRSVLGVAGKQQKSTADLENEHQTGSVHRLVERNRGQHRVVFDRSFGQFEWSRLELRRLHPPGGEFGIVRSRSDTSRELGCGKHVMEPSMEVSSSAENRAGVERCSGAARAVQAETEKALVIRRIHLANHRLFP